VPPKAAAVQYLFPSGAVFGADNVILHAKAKRHRTTGFAGPLSIKTVIRGEAAWKVARRELLVDANTFLVLGPGETYSLDIDAARPVETACAFFRDGFVESIVQDATTPVEASLDDPTRSAPALPYLFRLHSDARQRIIGRTQTLARRCSAELQPSSYEEDFLLLAKNLVLLYRQVQEQMARVPALKSSTREELYRRLDMGREYIHSFANEPLSLEAVASEACLSRYHFHRAFTQVFKKTPHAYLTEVRLARAQSLLRSGTTVEQVCEDVGFSSASSFSRLFRTRYGRTPGAMRRS